MRVERTCAGALAAHRRLSIGDAAAAGRVASHEPTMSATAAMTRTGLRMRHSRDVEEFALERRGAGCGVAPCGARKNTRDGPEVEQDGAIAQALDGLGDVAREQHGG